MCAAGPADAVGLIMPPGMVLMQTRSCGWVESCPQKVTSSACAGVPMNTVAVPLKYRFCAQAAPNYLTTGNGTAT